MKGWKKVVNITDTHKQCSVCHEMKLKCEFHKATRNKYGLDPQCTKCKMACRERRFMDVPDLYFRKLARDAAYHAKNKDKMRSGRMLRLYGITLKDYKRMYKKQEGHCAICDRHESEFKKTLAIDHCHKTMAVRELLCIDCNTVLGRFKDQEHLFYKSINYIRRHNGEEAGR